MRDKLLKLPKQLSFSFMKDPEIEKMAHLSKEERSELIQALAELILACAKAENPIKIEEIHDDEL
jgi:hypothetical protein